MRWMKSSEAPIIVVLDRLVLLVMLLILAAILTAAMIVQYAFSDLPCPLCLLQRVAMLGCCFGLIQQLRAGGSERGTGISLVFALLLLVISVRQTLLDLFPRPDHSYIGRAIFGIHMEVWSVFVAVALLLGFAIRFALFGAPRAAPETEGSMMGRFARGLAIYVIFICAINFLSVVLQCGIGQCHTFGYRLLP
jgi:disulfide bond formation protein DsbB